MRIVFVNLLLLFLFASESFAFCYQKVMSAANRTPGMALGCFDTAPVYTPSAGCTVSSSAMQGCLAVYQICCDSSVTGYETGAPHVNVLTGVDVGSEYEAAALFYEEMQVYGYAAPACDTGFQSTWETKGMVYNSVPDPDDFTKSKVTVSTFYRQGCDVFSNSTSGSFAPIGSGGGSGSGTVTVDMTATNDLLTAIKASVEAAGNTGNNAGVITAVDIKGQLTIDAVNNIKALLDTGGVANPNALLQSIKGVLDGLGTKGTEGNQLLTDIKTILQNGTGSTVNVDMTETNALLTDSKGILGGIKDKIDVLYDSITGFINTGDDNGDISMPDTSGIGTGLDASLSGVGVNPSGPGGLNEQLDASLEFHGKAGKSSFQEIFETHRTAWMASSSSNSLFTWINSLNANFASGLPSFNFNLPWVKVNRNIDLNDYSILFDMFRICVLFTATIVSYRIVFKG